MACVHCVEKEGHSDGPRDPEYPVLRTYGTHGPKILPPPGFEPARVCLACGGIYYPRILPASTIPTLGLSPRRVP